MGFEEEFEELDSDDRAMFKRCVNSLLRHTFILPQRYDVDTSMKKGNPEHAFAFRSFSLLADYFSYMGITLEKNEEYSIVSIKDNDAGARIHFSLLATQLLLMLRLKYDEERKKLSFSSDVKVTIAEIVQRLTMLAGLKKRPSSVQVGECLRRIANFRIITKQGGSFDVPTTEILIHPTILFIVSQERLETLTRLIAEPTGKEAEKPEDDEEASDEEAEADEELDDDDKDGEQQ